MAKRMSVVSRALRTVNPQAVGGVRVREVHTDGLGVEWYVDRSAANETAATTEMNARDLSANMEQRDREDALAWVQDRNPVSTFSLTGRDITEAQAEDYVVTWFATNLGQDAITVAWWIEAMNPPTWTTIANRIGYTTQQRSDVQDRAIDLAAAEPRFDLIVEA